MRCFASICAVPMSALVLWLMANLCHACLWDRETRQTETREVPDDWELVAGYFVRHSSVYYQWRLDDRNLKPQADWDALDWDDVAVAHEKLGQRELAIATIQQKIERYPNHGLYESEANLGTFLIHDGRLDQGLQHIRQAININPDAHFGREIYQQLLVEYVLLQQQSSKQLPLAGRVSSQGNPYGFAKYVLEKRRPQESDTERELDSAVQGVKGMMRFGNHASPILLEALGDLILSKAQREPSDVQLAAAAYLKASYEVSNEHQRAAYRVKAKEANGLQDERTLRQVEKRLQHGMTQAQSLVDEIRSDETRWRDLGANLDEKFWEFYADGSRYRLSTEAGQSSFWTLDLTVVTVLAIVVAWLGLFLYYNRNSSLHVSGKLRRPTLPSE